MNKTYKQDYLEYFSYFNKTSSPRALVTLSRIILVIILLVIIFLFVTPWVQTARGSGKITAFYPQDRLQNISALVDGRIRKWYVREGSTVKKGDPILEITDNDPQLFERLTIERDAKIKKYEAAKIATDTSEINYKRQEELFNKGLSSRKDFEDAKIKYKSLKSKQAQVASELAQAEVKLSRQNTQLIVAPSDGIITQVESGDYATYVKKGTVVATFTPDNAKQAVELNIDGLDVPLVHPGRKVSLIFEGWPAVQFSGWPSVAIGTFGGEVKVVAPSVSNNGKFKVIIVEDEDGDWPDRRFLRFGTRVNGWVLLDEVKVGYELWRQLNNFPPEYVEGKENKDKNGDKK